MDDWVLGAAVIGAAAILLTKNPVTQAANLILDPLIDLENALGVGGGSYNGPGVPVDNIFAGVPVINGAWWLN